MIRVFTLDGDHLTLQPISDTDSLPENALWIDLLEPTKQDDKRVEELTKVAIPTREDMKEIEESSRFLRRERRALHDFSAASLR